MHLKLIFSGSGQGLEARNVSREMSLRAIYGRQHFIVFSSVTDYCRRRQGSRRREGKKEEGFEGKAGLEGEGAGEDL